MTFPSGACQTCKDRRIKCDETKPLCRRCIKSGRVCLDPSVVQQASFLIHNESSYASGKAKRPRGPRSKLSLPRPQLDLESQALAYCLNVHLKPLKDVTCMSGCLPECLSVWIKSGRTCSMVDLALSTLALAVFSRVKQHQEAAREASLRYYRLLRIVQQRIAQLSTTCDEKNMDACMLTVLLMLRYGGTLHSATDLDFNSSFALLNIWSHHDGAMAILKIWNNSPSRNSYIIKIARRGLIRTSLIRDIPLPHWIVDGSRYGEYGLEKDYDRILIQILILRNTFVSLKKENSLHIAKAVELHEKAKELDKSLQEWKIRAPSVWAYQEHMIEAHEFQPRRHFYSSIAYTYPKIAYSAPWAQIFAAGMLIYSTHLRVLEIICSKIPPDSDYERQRLQCITRLNDVAGSLAATIPFSLERIKRDDANVSSHHISISFNEDDEIKPYLISSIIWPLVVAAGLQGIDSKQKLWFRSELMMMRSILADDVLGCAEKDKWAVI